MRRNPGTRFTWEGSPSEPSVLCTDQVPNVVLKASVRVPAAPLLLAALALSGAAAQVATGDDDDAQRIRIPSRLTVEANKAVELLVSREAGMNSDIRHES